KNLTTPAYVLTEYPFYDFAMNALVGSSGAGKSFVALDFAAKMAQRLEERQAGTVAYIAAEGLHGYATRWEAWKEHHRAMTDGLVFYPEPVNFMNDEVVGRFVENASR